MRKETTMTTTAVNPIRRILLAAGTAAMVSTAVVFGATADAEESSTTAPITLATSTSALPDPNGLHSEFCPFGKAHKHGKGCRGGSLTKGKPRKCVLHGGLGAIGGFAAGSPGGITAPQGAVLGAATGCASSFID